MKKRKKTIVFDFGSKNTKVLIGSSKENLISIEKYAIIPTPVDAIFDGKAYHKAAITESIEKFTRGGKIKRLNIMISISSSELILRTFEMPKMEEKELKAAIKFELEHLLPRAVEHYVIDFTILDEYEKEMEDGDKAPMLTVQTAALPKMIVDAYLAIFEKAGLNIDIVDIQANSISKLFCGRKKFIKDFDDEETIDKNVAVIDLGHQKTTVTIIEHGKVFLNRVINKGGMDITNVIAEKLDLSNTEAEKWKLGNDYLIEHTNEKLDLAIEDKMGEIILEINKIIDYFISRSVLKKLDRIYLIGGGAKARDITNYFEKALNITTTLGNDYRNIKVNMDESKFLEDLLYLCNVLGILLRKE